MWSMVKVTGKNCSRETIKIRIFFVLIFNDVKKETLLILLVQNNKFHFMWVRVHKLDLP